MPEETPAPTEVTPEEGCGKQLLGCLGMCLAFGVFVGGCSMLFDNKPEGYRDCFDAAFNLMEAQGVGFLERSGRAREICE
jgi:hypothetical protein